MLKIVPVFIFVFSGLPISNRVWALPNMQLNPSPVLPVYVTFQVDTEFPCGPVKVNLIIEYCTYFLICAVVYFDSTYTSGVVEHFTPELYCVLSGLLNL
jgi:hypothetical protein